MYACWLCGEELTSWMTWCPKCSAAQELPPDPIKVGPQVVDGKIIPVGRTPTRAPTFVPCRSTS